MRYKWIYFVIIILFALPLRFSRVNAIPPSLTWDEVSWGYNAYSLGIDARDEFGVFLPVTYLESFGDFKPPLYAYLGILPVKIFGLNEFATRFPSAFFGTLSVIVTYFFVKQVFGNRQEGLALLSSLMLAISPWHIMLSRAAFEANVAQFLIVIGLLLFLISLHKYYYLLVASSICFVLSMYTFNSARIVVPLLVVFLVIVYRKKLLKNWKSSIAASVIGLLLFTPLMFFINTPQSKLRFNEVNIFTDSSIVVRANEQIANDNNSFYSKIIHNRRLQYGVEYIRHYFDNITPQFLFIKGDGNPKFSIQDVGQLYIWEIPFLIIGLLILFRKKEKYWFLMPVMIVIGIIPAGFARETPHALRIENTLPAFQILSSLGIITFLDWFKNKRKWVAGVLISIFMVGGLIYFLHNYFTHYAREFSGEWQYGYKESIDYVQSNKSKYNKVFVTEQLGRPYIYYLFYMKYLPSDFRKDSEIYREPLGFVHVKRFSNIHFTDKINQIYQPNALYISTRSEKPSRAKILKEFKLLNGQTALVAYTL